MRRPGEVDWVFKKAAADAGLSQRELAKKVGINRTLISMYVRGRYVLSEIERKKIARTLKVPEASIFSD